MDADIFVYPANLVTHGLDPVLLNHPRIHILTHTIEESPFLAQNRIKIVDKQINPLTGLHRIGPRGQSQIVGAPKMHLDTVPTLNNSEHPHQIMSTGSITANHYAGKKYIQGRTDEIAKHDHDFGAIIVEPNLGALSLDPSQKGEFHWRHIEFIPEKKGFMDLDRFYTADSIEDVRPEAFVMGDIHVGDLDPAVAESLLVEIRKKNPKRVVIHDLFNGHSISHHDSQKIVHLAQKAKEGRLDLAHELREVARFLERLILALPDAEIVVVHSNHDFWLHRWLQDGRFTKEPHNTAIGFELGHAYVQYLENPRKNPDPLLYGIMKFAESPLLNANLTFLSLGEAYSVGPKNRAVELGLHGHVGANGGKGSIQTYQKGVGRIVYGHTHTEARRSGAVNVGTATRLELPYTIGGLSSWVQSYALVGPNGEIQVLRFNKGFWHLSEDDFGGQVMPAEDFYPEGFPKIIPNNRPTVGDFDQYGGEPN
jgi:UDP-2,3-diacylglucosamine pyrophosphatase LpxH